ncbi:hypothetical protein [Kribbella lupini]|uniref:hypothetical protein n=1 Tax=Kribbella lupini TaxID=291602 RepID=UPI0031D3C902
MPSLTLSARRMVTVSGRWAVVGVDATSRLGRVAVARDHRRPPPTKPRLVPSLTLSASRMAAVTGRWAVVGVDVISRSVAGRRRDQPPARDGPARDRRRPPPTKPGLLPLSTLSAWRMAALPGRWAVVGVDAAARSQGGHATSRSVARRARARSPTPTTDQRSVHRDLHAQLGLDSAVVRGLISGGG